MRHPHPVPSLLLIASSVALALNSAVLTAGEPAAAELPVTGVTLYASGVGAYEHAGTVTGDATVGLRFRADQLNDVLKSLVVQDTGGKIGAVSYPSPDPVERTLRSFRIDLSGDPSLAQLLGQLRGAVVTVQQLDRTISGTVLGVERHQKIIPETRTSADYWSLNLFSDGQVIPVPLEEVRSIKPTDETLRADVERALAALATLRDREQKTVTARFSGAGERVARLQYVVEAPVWKVSYRVLLSDGKDEAKLQGWALVDNTTQADWRNITLTLVSGRPISFTMDLAKPIYNRRPDVAPDIAPGINPVAFDGGREETGEILERRLSEAQEAEKPSAHGYARAAAAAPVKAKALREAAAQLQDYSGSLAVATKSTQEFGELFQYNIGAVSINRGQAAMIPIVDLTIPAVRVSIYDPAINARHPLSGVRLTNKGALHLSPGPVTVFDANTYAGDARLTATAPGQERLLGFALDQRVLVEVKSEAGSNERSLLKIVKGVMETRIDQRIQRQYVITNQGPAPKPIVVQHQRAAGFDLIETAKPVETTDTQYRFQITVKPGETTTLAVSERQVVSESIALVNLTEPGAIAYWLNLRTLTAAQRQALSGVYALAGERAAEQRAGKEAEQRIQALATEQQRTRDNIRTVPGTSEFAKKQIEKLAKLDGEIDVLRSEVETRRSSAEAKRQALETAVAALTVE